MSDRTLRDELEHLQSPLARIEETRRLAMREVEWLGGASERMNAETA